MTHVRLDNVVMPEARQLKFSEPPRVLAGALSGDAVYAEVKRSHGKCLVLSVNINEGDLAFRTAFPIMVTNALGWFAGQTGELRPSLTTGSLTQIELVNENRQSGDELLLRSPAGNSQPLHVRGEASGTAAESAADQSVTLLAQSPRVSIPPLSECGVWSIVGATADETGESVAELAVNLASASETDVRTPPELIDQLPDSLAAGWFTRPIWFYLAAFACLLTVTEWWLYQRRVIT
jgi:hypothetical protein